MSGIKQLISFRHSKRASAILSRRALALRNMRPALLRLAAYLNFQLLCVNYNFLLTFRAVNRTMLKNGPYDNF